MGAAGERKRGGGEQGSLGQAYCVAELIVRLIVWASSKPLCLSLFIK